MSSEWRRISFEALIQEGVLQIGDGYRAKLNELGGSGLIFLRSAHVRDSHIEFEGTDRFHVGEEGKLRVKISAPGDVMVTTKGNSTGRTGYVTRQMPPFVYSPHLSYWRSLDPNKLVPGFLRAWSNSADFKAQLKSMCHSTDMAPYMSLSDQKRLEVSLAPRPTQEAIAALNESIDDRITLLREANATLEAITQALFKSWFVDFDPVRAKQEGRAPEGMDEATAALFPDGFEESALGLVPKGWQVGKLGDVARLQKGAINPLSQPSVLFEHYSLPAFDNGQAPVFEVGGEIKSNKTAVPPNAVLLSKLNPHIPRVWLPTSPGQRAVCSTEFLVFIPMGAASREFVLCTFSAPQFLQSLCQLVTGTSNSHQRIRPDGVLSMASVIPPESVLETFEGVAKPIFDRIGHNRHQAQTLATLRDTLLPRLISGQLRLPEVELAVAAAL